MNSVEAYKSEVRLCEHGTPMRWNKDTNKSAGGNWYCVEKRKASSAKADKLKLAARSRQWRKDNPILVKEIDRRSKLKRLYGITSEEYDSMYGAQNGLCGICSVSEGTLVVDHDHETGEVRGLLCSNCNTGLGLLQDSPEVLTLAALWLGGA